MGRGQDARARYQQVAREFEAVLEHAKSVSNSLVGLTPNERSLSYAEQIFVKVLAHCVSLRRLMPEPAPGAPAELWDVSSLSAVARCAIEAHDAFFYVVCVTGTAEREFRLRAWEFHDQTRRLRMLEAIGSMAPQTDQIRLKAEQLLVGLQACAQFGELHPAQRKKILDGDPPAYLQSQKYRCAAIGVDFDYYNAVTMQLSQHVHTLPFATHQLFQFRAGDKDALHLMSLPPQFVLPFLSRVTLHMAEIFPGRTATPPSRTLKTMQVWRSIAAKGLKGSPRAGSFQAKQGR